MGDTLEQSQAGDQEKYEHLPDNTIGTLAQLLRDIIPLTNNKVLAKDLKHFATLQISHGVGGVGTRMRFDRRVAAADGLINTENLGEETLFVDKVRKDYFSFTKLQF